MDVVTEIRDLYVRQCEYATRLQSMQDLEHQRLKDAVRPRRSVRYPEMQHFASVFEWHDAVKLARQDPRIRGRTKVVQTLNWIVVFAACLASMLHTDSLLTTLGLAALLGGTFLGVEQHFIFRPHLQRSLREQLVQRGVPICVGCGYDLRGQIHPRCPECGMSCAPSLLTGK